MSCDFEWDACGQQLLSGLAETMYAAGIDCAIGEHRQVVEPGDEDGAPVWRLA